MRSGSYLEEDDMVSFAESLRTSVNIASGAVCRMRRERLIRPTVRVCTS
ncbi:hypothetical protein ACVXG9_15090 [Escherichia coli]